MYKMTLGVPVAYIKLCTCGGTLQSYLRSDLVLLIRWPEDLPVSLEDDGPALCCLRSDSVLLSLLSVPDPEADDSSNSARALSSSSSLLIRLS